MRMSRLVWIALIAIGIGLAGMIFYDLTHDHSSLTIANYSGRTIPVISVSVSRSHFDLGPLTDGDIRSVRIQEYSVSHWRIEGKWADGRTFQRDFGYITHGQDNNDTVTI